MPRAAIQYGWHVGKLRLPLTGPPAGRSPVKQDPASQNPYHTHNCPIGLPPFLKESLRCPPTSPFSETMGCSKLRTQGQPSPKCHHWLLGAGRGKTWGTGQEASRACPSSVSTTGRGTGHTAIHANGAQSSQTTWGDTRLRSSTPHHGLG